MFAFSTLLSWSSLSQSKDENKEMYLKLRKWLIGEEKIKVIGSKRLKEIIFKKQEKKFVLKNFKLSNFYFINIFDIGNGLVRKCKKPDDGF